MRPIQQARFASFGNIVTHSLACRPRLRHLDAGCGGGDHRRAPHLARRAIGRALSRRGAILVLGAASRLRLLLEAAARRLADLADHGGIRRQRVCHPPVGAAAPCRRRRHRLRDRRPALRPPRRVLVGARLCDAAGRVAVGLHHLDRRGAAAVLGGGALCLHPRARAGRRAAGGWSPGSPPELGLLAKYAMAYWFLSAFGFVLLVPGGAAPSAGRCSPPPASRC